MSYGAQLLTEWDILCALFYMVFFALLGAYEYRRTLEPDVPAWSDQSRKFMPGVLFLAWFIACGGVTARRAEPYWRESEAMDRNFWILAVVAVGVGVFSLQRRRRQFASTRSFSPSSALVEALLYVVTPILAVRVALPGYLYGLSVNSILVLASGVLALVLWGACVFADAVRLPRAVSQAS